MNSRDHLYVKLMEECAEVIQRASKQMLFGRDERSILDPTGPTNEEKLREEIIDVRICIDKLIEAGELNGISDGNVQKQREEKTDKIRRMMARAREMGNLKDEDAPI